jgi:hypothetical protein
LLHRCFFQNIVLPRTSTCLTSVYAYLVFFSNATRSSLTETSTFAFNWLISLHAFAEKDLRFVRELPMELARPRAHAWIVALKHQLLTYFSATHMPTAEIWYVKGDCENLCARVMLCQVNFPETSCNYTVHFKRVSFFIGLCLNCRHTRVRCESSDCCHVSLQPSIC